jgi:uncharacterized protein (DUF427 family)
MNEIVANPHRVSLAGMATIAHSEFAKLETFPGLEHPIHVATGESPMVKALWGGKVIAESSDCVVVEGNQYFPAEAVKKQYLKPSAHTSICPWKGTAHYYHLDVDGMRNENAVWFYPEPKLAAKEITGRVAFWKGVRVEG